MTGLETFGERAGRVRNNGEARKRNAKHRVIAADPARKYLLFDCGTTGARLSKGVHRRANRI